MDALDKIYYPSSQKNNMANIKKNFFYSSVLTTANYLFPMLTYPYVARVLGVDKIGLCNFADSIISYFLLFSMMGIGTVGIREIAKYRGNQEKLDQAYSSLFTLNSITTVIAVIALLIATYCVPQLYANKELMFVGAVRLLVSYLQIEWLFKGLEDFKYITVRTLTIKVFYVIGVFLFVRTKNDYVIYFALYTLMVAVNAIINVWYARHFVHFVVKRISISPFIKSFVILGIYMFLTSLYGTFNVAFLGFTSNETQVGYYTTATKLYTILLSLFSAFTGVMMPRMSSLLAEGKKDEFKNLLHRSVNILMMFSTPLVFFSIVFAPQIIGIISGKGYEGAILPMRIAMPLMLIIGYEQILVIQTLMPLKKDRAILINSAIGAATGLLLNIIIVPYLQSVGSSIVWFLSECMVLISAQYFVTKYVGLRFPFALFLKNLLAYVPMMFFIIPIYLYVDNIIVSFILGGLIMCVYSYVLNIHILHNEEALNFYKLMVAKIKR